MLRKVILPSIEYFISTLVNLPWIGPFINLWLSFCGTISRCGAGLIAARNLPPRPPHHKPLIIFQYEGCPFCRRVRECLSVLQLDVVVYPCPRTTLAAYGVVSKNSRFRPTAQEMSGKCMFPILVDPNEDNKVVVDSAVIVSYLWLKYGEGAVQPWNYTRTASAVMLSLPSAFRLLPRMGILKVGDSDSGSAGGGGSSSSSPVERLVRPSLELFALDACPYSRLVREVLDSNEVPYLMRSRRPEGGTTPTLVDRSGKQSVTLNGDVWAILAHVQKHHVVAGSAVDQGAVWGTYSTTGASKDHGVMA